MPRLPDMLVLRMRHRPRAFGAAPLFLALATRPFLWVDAFTGRTAASSSRACRSPSSGSGRGSGNCSAACQKLTCPTSRGKTLTGKEATALAWKCRPKALHRCRPGRRSLYGRWAGHYSSLWYLVPVVPEERNRFNNTPVELRTKRHYMCTPYITKCVPLNRSFWSVIYRGTEDPREMELQSTKFCTSYFVRSTTTAVLRNSFR